MGKRINNLDGLRFVAAFVVLICHAEIIKTFFGFPPLTSRFFHNSAQLAVTFFFVLSGFLITWILLSEKRKDPAGNIHVPRFYKKRILRIWPLYYLLLGLAFFVLPRFDFFNIADSNTPAYDNPLFRERFYGYFFWLPNYTDLKYGSALYMGQTWSLAVEEFFYLLFPVAIYLIPYKKIRSFLFIITLLFVVISVGIRLFAQPDHTHSNLIKLLIIYADRYRIYSFSLGAIAAYYWINQNEIRPWIRKSLSKWCGHGILISLSVMVLAGLTFSVVTQQAYSLFFALLLFVITINQNRYRLLNTPVLVYLGRISYGIYMFHPFAIVAALQILKHKITKEEVALSAGVIDSVALIITILLSILSYELYEKVFLRFARKKTVFIE